MKPGANYRMTKSGKIYLAVTWNRANKKARRRSIILGEMHGAVVIKSRRERDSA